MTEFREAKFLNNEKGKQKFQDYIFIHNFSTRARFIMKFWHIVQNLITHERTKIGI